MPTGAIEVGGEIKEKKPTLLDGIVEFTRWQVVQPYTVITTFNFEVYDAVFLVDFGPWKKGEKPHTLGFNVFTGRLYESNNWELLVKDCMVRLVPVTE